MKLLLSTILTIEFSTSIYSRFEIRDFLSYICSSTLRTLSNGVSTPNSVAPKASEFWSLTPIKPDSSSFFQYKRDECQGILFFELEDVSFLPYPLSESSGCLSRLGIPTVNVPRHLYHLLPDDGNRGKDTHIGTVSGNSSFYLLYCHRSQIHDLPASLAYAFHILLPPMPAFPHLHYTGF